MCAFEKSASLVLLLFLAVGARGQAAYLLSTSDDPGGPSYEFINISDSGEQVVEDNIENGGAAVDLKVPIVFYDESVYRVVVSVNGYISTLGIDPGLDDDPKRLPLGPTSGGGGRIYPYHADLDLGNSSGGFPRGVFYQYFHRSPHPHSTGGVHVFQWQRVNHHDGPQGLLTFQALIFDNADVLFQYQNTPGAVGTRDYTAGVLRRGPLLPGQGVTFAAYHDSEGDPEIAGGLAVLFEPPSIEVTSVAQSPPIGFINLNDAVGVAGSREIVHKIEFAPFLAGQVTELSSNLEVNCTDGVEPYCVRSPAIIIDASDLDGGHRIVAEGLSQAGHPAGRFMFGADNIGNSTSPFNESRFTPKYIHFNNVECVGENAGILVQDDFCSLIMTDCLFKDATNGVVVFEDFTGERTTRQSGQIVMRGCEVDNCAGYSGSSGFLDELFSFRELMPFGALSGTGVSLHDCVFTDNDGVVFGNNWALGNGGIGRPEIEINRCSIAGGSQTFGEIARPRSLSIDESSFESAGLKLYRVNDLEEMELAVDRSFFGGMAYESTMQTLARVSNSTFSGGERFILQRGTGNNNPGDLYMTNCTVVRDAKSAQPAVRFTSAGFENFRFRAENCIFSGGQVATDHFDVNPQTTLTAIAGRACLSDRVDSVVSTTPDLTPKNPQLLPLAMNGGPTFTHLPQAGSVALDGGSEITLVEPLAATDQRGELRKFDFDGDGTAEVDIGAVEVEPITEVTTLVDESVVPGTGVSLREALASATPGSRITFAAGLSGGAIDLGGRLEVTADVNIDASELAQPVSLRSGSNAFTLMDVADGVAISLLNVHFSGGQRGIAGGNNQTLELTDVRIENADAGNDSGGGIFVGTGSSLHARRVEIVSCEAWQGAGIYVSASDIELEDCWIHGCVATKEGGGIFVGGAGATGPRLSRCALTRNRAIEGAGFYKAGMPSDTSGLSIVGGCTIGENVGGGIFNAGGPLLVRFSTLHKNSDRGGVVGSLAATQYYHVIATANTSDGRLTNLAGGASGGYNLVDGDGGVLVGSGDLILLDAQLTPLGWHGGATPTYAPLAGSPAVNAGDQLYNSRNEFYEETDDYVGPLRDARGVTRPRFSAPYLEVSTGTVVTGPLPDIGAVELMAPLVVGTQVDQNQNPAGSVLSLREALRDCPDGGRITFAPGLNGAISDLDIGELNFAGKAVMIDATDLPRGFRLRGDGERCLQVGVGGSLSMHAVSLADGSAGEPGGGVLNRGKLLVTRAAIHDCVASGNGGGIEHAGDFLHVENCTLSGNEAQGRGGAISHSGDGEIHVSHCTISGNSALAGGSGIRLDDADLQMMHTVFEGNGRNRGDVLLLEGGGKLVSGGYNLEDGGDIEGVATDTSNEAAGLGRLADNGGHALSHWPFATSPVRDGGARADPIFSGKDQLGGRRLLGGHVDIGALEIGGYYDWVRERTSVVTLQDFDADFDGDGLENGLDYLLGAAPSTEMTPAGLELEVVWESLVPDVDFAVESSTDMSFWQTVYEVRQGIAVNSDWLESLTPTGALRKAVILDPDGEEGFLRIRATLR